MKYFNKGSAVVVAVIVIIILGIIGGGIWYYVSNKPKACTQEAKLCPDGTSVGRTGPNCEFAECPTAPGCKNLWWYDNEHLTCQQPKQFCGAYMYYGLQTFETKEECENTLAIKDWKTYKSTKYGYQTKYPSNWNVLGPEINEKSDLGGLYITPNTEQLMMATKNVPACRIDVFLNFSMSPKEFAERMINAAKYESSSPVDSEDTYLNNIKAIKLEEKNRQSRPWCNEASCMNADLVMYIFSYENKLFQITYSYLPSEKSEYKPIFEKILSTLEFTK